MFAIRKTTDDNNSSNSTLANTSTTSQISSSASAPILPIASSDSQSPLLNTRSASKQSNLNNCENRTRKKSIETASSPYFDTASLDKVPIETQRNQTNDIDLQNDSMTQARIGAQELRSDILEKKSNDKDSDKDSVSTQRSGSIKKKFRKQEENLYRILNSPDCLNEAAITLNFLVRRLFCDVFQETFFEQLLKEKLELKLKELAVCI